jgi:hypothetical protein
MRYITATIGAIFILVGVLIIGFFWGVLLPADINPRITINLGLFSVWGNLSVVIGMLIGVPLGIAAAIHTFRSTVRRSAPKPPERPDTL